MSALLAVDDGLTNSNFNVADIMFLAGVVFAALAGLSYAAGFTGTVDAAGHRPYAGFHQWAAALVAFAVGFVAFGLFLL